MNMRLCLMDNKRTGQFILEGFSRSHHRPHFPQNGLPLIADVSNLQAILNAWPQYNRATRRQFVELYLNLQCENRWLDRGCPDINILDHLVGKSYHPLILLVGCIKDICTRYGLLGSAMDDAALQGNNREIIRTVAYTVSKGAQ